MIVYVKEYNEIPSPTDRRVCFFCLEELEPINLCRVYMQDGEDSGLMDFGFCCSTCGHLKPSELRVKFLDRVFSRDMEIDSEQEDLDKILYQYHCLQQHLEWMQEKIEDLRKYIFDKREAHKMFESLARQAQIFTLASNDDDETLPNPLHDKPQKERPGYVYLIASSDGHYKIGRAKDVPTRANTLKIQLPFQIEIVHYFKAMDYIKSESMLHDYFSENRLNGEWFKLSPEQVEWFKTLHDEEEIARYL